MDEIKSKLEAAGVDIKGAMNRMMNNEMLFTRLMKKMREDTNYQKMLDAWNLKDYETTYEAAHTLKGAAGNLGLDPIYKAAGIISDTLKNYIHNDADLDETFIDSKFEELGKSHKEIFDILNLIP